MTKRALCIGINDYPGTGSDLSGCVNDAQDWAGMLKGRGFEVTTMLDKNATKANMASAMTELVRGAAYGDLAVITYSGHGTWVPDQDGDEADQRDEALCPYDINRGNFLVDDELYDIFQQRQRGARIVFISDSCHSGTVSRMAQAIGDNPVRVRFLPPETFLSSKALEVARHIPRASPDVRAPTPPCCSPAARTGSSATTHRSTAVPTARSPTPRCRRSAPFRPLPRTATGSARSGRCCRPRTIRSRRTFRARAA
jgi:Caspase domain